MPVMPIIPEFPSGQVLPGEERLALTDFTHAVEQFLENLIETTAANPMDSFFMPELIPLMSQTWLSEMPSEFAALRDRIPTLPDQQLKRHGFAGLQLRFKFEVVRSRVRAFIADGFGETLGRLLDSIDALLDSILDAAGVGTAIKEFKEALKNSIASV